ncbi:hypothetical protein BH11CYA1_BH11CYA1_16740 [soil metagenome]
MALLSLNSVQVILPALAAPKTASTRSHASKSSSIPATVLPTSVLPATVLPASRLAASTTPGNSYFDVTELSFKARDRFEAQPKNPEAAYNFAVYQTLVGDRQFAQQIFAKAVELKPDDFFSHLGLAQTTANDPLVGAKGALPQLARAQSLALDSSSTDSLSARCAKLEALGKTFLLLSYADKTLPRYKTADELRFAATALTIYQKLFELQPTNRHVLQMLVRSALAANNFKAAAAQMTALRAGSVADSQLLLDLASNCRAISQTSPKLDQFIIAQAKANFSTDADLFYALGRKFDLARYDLPASQCYSNANALVPDEAQFVLAYTSQLVSHNKRPEALVLLKKLAARIALQEPSLQRAALATVVPTALKLLQKPHLYKCGLVEFSYLSCACKISSFNYLLRHVPGVVYARIIESKGPYNLVIYDPAITDPGKVGSKLGKEATYKLVAAKANGIGTDANCEIGPCEFITDFPGLVRVVLASNERAARSEHKFYDFDPLPLLPVKI